MDNVTKFLLAEKALHIMQFQLPRCKSGSPTISVVIHHQITMVQHGKRGERGGEGLARHLAYNILPSA